MTTWQLEAYDTEMRQVRSRRYTTSKRIAEAWGRIPRVQFTDSGHGVVFTADEHHGKRKPAIESRAYDDKLDEALGR